MLMDLVACVKWSCPQAHATLHPNVIIEPRVKERGCLRTRDLHPVKLPFRLIIRHKAAKRVRDEKKVFHLKTMFSVLTLAKRLSEVLQNQIQPICLCISRSMHVSGRTLSISRLAHSDHTCMFQESTMGEQGSFTDCHLNWKLSFF